MFLWGEMFVRSFMIIFGIILSQEAHFFGEVRKGDVFGQVLRNIHLLEQLQINVALITWSLKQPIVVDLTCGSLKRVLEF